MSRPKYDAESTARALEMHRDAGLIAGWVRRNDGTWLIMRPSPAGALWGGTFELRNLREAHVFINGLACAAQAVDTGTASKSAVAQVREHLESTGEIPIPVTDVTWTDEDSAEANAEGWDIFESDGSDNGPYQLCKIDEPGEWAANRGVTQVPALAEDTDAWVLVRDTPSYLHSKALAYLRLVNPQELAAIYRWQGEPS